MTHKQMTYPEIVSFFKEAEQRPGGDLLSFDELNHYYHSLYNDPILAAMVRFYPPYTRNFEKVIQDSVTHHQYQSHPLYAKLTERERHFASERAERAERYIKEKYLGHENNATNTFNHVLKVVEQNFDVVEQNLDRDFRSHNVNIQALNIYKEQRHHIAAIANFIKKELGQPNIFGEQSMLESVYSFFSSPLEPVALSDENPLLMRDPIYQQLSEALIKYAENPIDGALEFSRSLCDISTKIAQKENPEVLLGLPESIAYNLTEPFLYKDPHGNVLPTQTFYDIFRSQAPVGREHQNFDYASAIGDETGFSKEHGALLLSALRDTRDPLKDGLTILRNNNPSPQQLQSLVAPWDKQKTLTHYEQYINHKIPGEPKRFMAFETRSLSEHMQKRFLDEFDPPHRTKNGYILYALNTEHSLSLFLIERIYERLLQRNRITFSENKDIFYNMFLYSIKVGGDCARRHFLKINIKSFYDSPSEHNFPDLDSIPRDLKELFLEAFNLAIDENRPETLKELIRYGYLHALYKYSISSITLSNPDEKFKFRELMDSMFRWACLNANEELIDILLKIKVPGLDKQYKQDIFMWATEHCPVETLTVFQQFPISVNYTDMNGNTPLIIALKTRDVRKVELILNSKSVEKIIDQAAATPRSDLFSGKTPMMIAVSQGNLDVVRLLVEKNAKFNKEELIAEASQKGFNDIADYFQNLPDSRNSRARVFSFSALRYRPTP